MADRELPAGKITAVFTDIDGSTSPEQPGRPKRAARVASAAFGRRR
jgi:hypothetical protein